MHLVTVPRGLRQEARASSFDFTLAPGRSIRLQLSPELHLNGLSTGGEVWDAALVLATYLCESFPGDEKRLPQKVVEIGSGAGLVGIVAHALGAKATVLTDMPDLMPLLEANVSNNAAIASGVVKAMPLTWGHKKHADDVLSALGDGPLLVVAADIIYPWLGDCDEGAEEQLHDLLSTLVALLINSNDKAGGSIALVAISQYDERLNEDFRRCARRSGFVVSEIARHAEFEEVPVSIWQLTPRQ